MMRALLVGLLLSMSCAGRNTPTSSAWLFDSPRASDAQRQAPDLFVAAKEAALAAESADRRGDARAAADRRTQARLLLAAAIVESERIDLETHRLQLVEQEEEAHRQLAAHQMARARIANDIARHRAKAIALKEAQAAHEIAERGGHGPRGRATRQQLLRARDTLLENLRLDLAAAEALGASNEATRPIAARADALERSKVVRLDDVEALLTRVSDLLGALRARASEPTFPMVASLMHAAHEHGFRADRLERGVVLTIDGLFQRSGGLNVRRLKRLGSIMQAFPHGPVQCSVLVQRVTSAWKRRAELTRRRLSRAGVAAERVSVEPVPADAPTPPPTRCTFIAYARPYPPFETP